MAATSDREQTVVIRWRRRIACEALAPALDRAFPTDQESCFDQALKAIDDAESAVWCDRDPGGRPPE
jgi:hypothetical protein